MNRGAWQAAAHGVARVRHALETEPPTNQILQSIISSISPTVIKYEVNFENYYFFWLLIISKFESHYTF